jgi:hypothetical protein
MHTGETIPIAVVGLLFYLVNVCLQHPLETGETGLKVHALPVRRIRESD